MSLTDDMFRLKEAADEIAKKRGKEIEAPCTIIQKTEGTYFSTRTEASCNPENVLKEYTLSTPVAFKEELSQMWTAMGKEDMFAFLPVCMASLAKNKPKEGMKSEEQVISPYIYEF